MDDLFKILIWGLIIFFFLRPLFKKQVPEKKNTGTRPESNPQSSSGSLSAKGSESGVQSSKKENYDILEELQNMFKGDLKIPEQPKAEQADPYDIYESHEIKDKDLSRTTDPRLQREVEDYKPIGYRPTYDEVRNANRKRVSVDRSQRRIVDAQTESEAQRFEKVLEELDKKTIRQNKYIRKIKNPKSIKEYIIFSEILGKPKALRR